MKNRMRWSGYGCLVMILATVAGCGGGPEPTRFHAAVGDSRTGSVDMTTQITVNAGMKMDITTTERVRLKLDVTEVAPEDGPITFNATIDLYDMGINMSMNGNDMSGMLPINAMLGDSMKAVVGKSFVLKVSPRGDIVAIEGAEAIQEAFLSASKVPMGGMSETGALSEEQLKRYCSQLFCPFPEEPVTEESRWESALHLSGEMDADITHTWFLKDQNEAFITFGANSQMESTSGGAMMGGFPGKGDMKGAGEATREIELSSGWVVMGTESMTLNGHVTLEGIPIPGGGDIEINGKMDVEAKTY